MNTIKLGDTVQWRGGWGNDPPKPAVVEQLEVTDKPGEKYGIDVEVVDVSLVKANRVVFGFTNGHWCYADQVDLPPEAPNPPGYPGPCPDGMDWSAWLAFNNVD